MKTFKKLELELKRLKEDIQNCEIREINPLWNNIISIKNPKKHLLQHIESINLLLEDIKEECSNEKETL